MFLSHFLNGGMTLASLQWFGTLHVDKDKFISCVSDGTIVLHQAAVAFDVSIHVNKTCTSHSGVSIHSKVLGNSPPLSHSSPFDSSIFDWDKMNSMH